MTSDSRSPASIWDIEKHFGDLLSDEGPTDPTVDQLMIRDLYLRFQQEKNRADSFSDKLTSIWQHWRNWLRVSRESGKHVESMSYARPEEFDIVNVSFPRNDFQELDTLITPRFR
jgi:hypothetical protein